MNRDIKESGNDSEGCTHGKTHRNPFPKVSQPRSTKPHEIIHSDICSPMKNPIKMSKWKHLCLWLFKIHVKREDKVKFIEFVNYVKNQSVNKQDVKTQGVR